MYPIAVGFDSNMRILEREEDNCGVLCLLDELQDTLLGKPDEKNSPQTHNSNANYTWKYAATWYHVQRDD